MKDPKLAKNLHQSETMERKPMNSLSVFTNSEIMKMENIFKETPQQSLTQEFFQNLATNFSCQPSRVGKSDITRQQVEGWFQSKRKEIQAKGTSSSGAFDWVVESHEDLSDLTMFSNAPDNSQKPKDPCVTDLSELAFEAKSSKDGAWYDVASFLSYRVVSSGELVSPSYHYNHYPYIPHLDERVLLSLHLFSLVFCENSAMGSFIKSGSHRYFLIHFYFFFIFR
ncbi:hypothetical protein ABKV19_009112 [Rosa sericea]